jgi:hypothetical protein
MEVVDPPAGCRASQVEVDGRGHAPIADDTVPLVRSGVSGTGSGTFTAASLTA